MVGHSEDHVEAKRDLATFLASNDYIGLQLGPDMLICMANCRTCHTTLCVLLLDAEIERAELAQLSERVNALILAGDYAGVEAVVAEVSSTD